MVEEALAFAPVGHVDRDRGVEGLVVAGVEKMQQFVQDDIVDAILRGLEKAFVEVDPAAVAAAASPQGPHPQDPQGGFGDSPPAHDAVQPVQRFPEPVPRLPPPPKAELAVYGGLVRRVRSRDDEPSVVADDPLPFRRFDPDM